MHLESLELVSSQTRLAESDFLIFASRFKAIVKECIPTTNEVEFPRIDTFEDTFQGYASHKVRRALEAIQGARTPQILDEHSLIMPLPMDGGFARVALVSGLDALIVEKATGSTIQNPCCLGHVTSRQICYRK